MLTAAGSPVQATVSYDSIAQRAVLTPAAALDVDPGARGPFTTVTSDYTLDNIRIPGLPARIERVGHVVRPQGELDQPARSTVAELRLISARMSSTVSRSSRVTSRPMPLWIQPTAVQS